MRDFANEHVAMRLSNEAIKTSNGQMRMRSKQQSLDCVLAAMIAVPLFTWALSAQGCSSQPPKGDICWNGGRNTKADAAKATLDTVVRVHATSDGITRTCSGTVVESHTAQSLVQTCGHVLGVTGQCSSVAVDLFTNGEFERYSGEVVSRSEDLDVAFVAIHPGRVLPAAQVGTIDDRTDVGEMLFCAGCPHGALPRLYCVRVTAVDAYEPPENIECNTALCMGMSGAGLFNASSRLVGFCKGVDLHRNRTLFCDESIVDIPMPPVAVSDSRTPKDR